MIRTENLKQDFLLAALNVQLGIESSVLRRADADRKRASQPETNSLHNPARSETSGHRPPNLPTNKSATLIKDTVHLFQLSQNHV
jgi:hypothetical protein